uniref:InlB B-repeat-containing protein n=2 Tax=Bifidobacterium indicum TaxID=1691 RepID=UPI0030DD3661
MVTKPAGMDRWTQADAGYSHSLAIGSDGNLYTWGNNSDGKLGRDTGSAGQDATPGMVTKPAGVDKWIQADAGENYSLAIGSDGNLYTWGNNYFDKLGRDTNTTPSNRPGMVTKPAGMDRWTQADAGYSHSLAIGSDGNLYTWGNNSDGKLGRDTGSAGQDATPGMVTKPAGVDKWTRADAGENYSLATDSDGNLYTWGYSLLGALGRDTDSVSPNGRPGRVAFPDQVGLVGVRFDGIAGVDLTAKTDGTWSVSTPSHAAGTVTVTVTWTLNGVAQPDEHLTYTYEAPVATRTVAFDPAGGSAVSAQRVMDGQKAVRPADPTRDGYRFNGWFNGTDPYGFDQPVTGDLTLTAHWTRSADEKPTTPTQKPTTPTQKPTTPTQKPTRPAKPVQKPTKPTDPTQKPIDHTQQLTGPADNPNPSGVLSSTGSDTAPILAAGILTLAAGILTLVSIRTGRRIAHGSSTK